MSRQPDTVVHRSEDMPVPLEDLLIDITGILSDLSGLVPMIRALPTTHRPGLEFVPVATRVQLGRQYLEERRERQLAASAGHPVGLGASAPPGDWTTSSLLHGVEYAIRHKIRFTLAREPQLAEVTGRREHETLTDTIWRLDGLMRRVTRRHVAVAVLRDLEHLDETVRQVLFGEDRVDLGTCPHCRRSTLVAYLQTGIIQCERPRDTDGHTPRCECTSTSPSSQLAGASALCPCHSAPRFNHFWLRDRKHTSEKSWHALEDALRHLSTPPSTIQER